MNTKQQERNELVLQRLIKLSNSDEDAADMLAEVIESMLDELQSDGFFGTEGENDPRGDFRNDEFSMEFVEGIDD